MPLFVKVKKIEYNDFGDFVSLPGIIIIASFNYLSFSKFLIIPATFSFILALFSFQ